jgi:acyl-coenzyme A thioesterase PaaI-like protein
MNGIDVSSDDVSPDTAALKDLDPPRDVERSTEKDGSDRSPAPAQPIVSASIPAGNTSGNGDGSSATAAQPEISDRIAMQRGAARGNQPKTLFDKVEAFVSKLSVRDNFWHSVCSFLWLPLAFFSGIRMRELDPQTFAAVLPFRRFNRNWYRAMAGGALLANSEIAGGMYVFGVCGGDYTVVCKNLNYTFLRPCFGPAVYRMTPREDIKQLAATGREFNITLDLEISQQGFKGERDRRVGRCEATFHVTPKVHHKAKKARKAGK